MRAAPLYRHYWWFSLLLMLLCGGVLGYTLLRFELQQLEALAQERNVTLTQVLRNVHAADIDAVVNSPASLSPVHVAAFMAKVRSILQDSDIAKLKVYDLQGRTVFSTDPSQIGEDKSGNPGYLGARAGQTISEITHRNQFSAFEQSLSDVDLVASYVPVLKNGQVMAVFELYQNVTPMVRRIDQSMWQVAAVLLLALGGLYTMLLALVRRAAQSEQQQKELLARANEELDQRVAQRTTALRLSEARMRSLTMMSSDFFWETDAQHRFTMRTPTTREVHDATFDPAELIGRLRWEVPYTSPDSASWESHRRVLDAHQPFRDFEIAPRALMGRPCM